MRKLAFKTSWCKYIPTVYENDSPKKFKFKENVIFKNGKYIYSPSEEYYEFFKKLKKIS